MKIETKIEKLRKEERQIANKRSNLEYKVLIEKSIPGLKTKT